MIWNVFVRKVIGVIRANNLMALKFNIEGRREEERKRSEATDAPPSLRVAWAHRPVIPVPLIVPNTVVARSPRGVVKKSI